MFPNSGNELIEVCNVKSMKIWEYTLEYEGRYRECNKEEIFELMKENLRVMKESAYKGLHEKVHSISGLIGGGSYKINKYMTHNETLTGEFMVKAMAYALSCSEVNASMGKIVAAPTAGSCGILPAVILSVGEKYNLSDDEMTKALFTASGIGMIIAKNATLSGAEGGCQAECGSASAMACGAAVEMLGGTAEMALNGAAIVIKNNLGLVCDPVGGLVEIPCAKRNVNGAIQALTTVDLVLSGVSSYIPFDDVVLAMYKIGKMMPVALKETALGGLADTPTGKKLKKQVFK